MQKKTITPESALIKVAALCARCEQAPADIRTKIVGWGLTQEEADQVIDQLKDENYINEDRYALAYCRDKVKFNGWGRIKVAFMLKSKGIGKSSIEKALDEINDALYGENLHKLLSAKYRDVAKKEPQQARAALLRLAASRGYEPEVFYPIVDGLMKDKTCNDE